VGERKRDAGKTKKGGGAVHREGSRGGVHRKGKLTLTIRSIREYGYENILPDWGATSGFCSFR